MAGFQLEFKRSYKPFETQKTINMIEIGQISPQHVHDWPGEFTMDSTPKCDLEMVAAQVQPPRISENFMAPVNDTTNRRCQEWTTDFIRRLVEMNYVHQNVLDKVQAMRDPPSHGIGLRPVAR